MDVTKRYQVVLTISEFDIHIANGMPQCQGKFKRRANDVRIRREASVKTGTYHDELVRWGFI